MWVTDKRLIILIAVFLIAAQFLWHAVLIDFEDSIWWFDDVLHLLGGWMVAALFLSFFEDRPSSALLLENTMIILIFIISFTALIGVFWEFYEYLIDYFFAALNMTLDDTLTDLLADLLGGLMAGWIYIHSRNSRIN